MIHIISYVNITKEILAHLVQFLAKRTTLGKPCSIFAFIRSPIRRMQIVAEIRLLRIFDSQLRMGSERAMIVSPSLLTKIT